MRFAVTRLDLGKTRLGVGYVIYNDVSKAFEELTPSEVKELIKKDEVTGLLLDDGEIKVDTSYCKNMMRKSGVGNFSPIFNYRSSNLVSVLSVVSKNETEFGFMYEVISNFCQRLIMNEETLKSYEKTGVVNGITIDENGNIIIHPRVGVYFITKPETTNKDDLNAAKINLNTEDGKIKAEEIKDDLTGMTELFDELDVGVATDEENNNTVFDTSDTCNTDFGDEPVPTENKSELTADSGDTKKSKSKRNSKKS